MNCSLGDFLFIAALFVVLLLLYFLAAWMPWAGTPTLCNGSAVLLVLGSASIVIPAWICHRRNARREEQDTFDYWVKRRVQAKVLLTEAEEHIARLTSTTPNEENP
jgi:hypothetical protein